MSLLGAQKTNDEDNWEKQFSLACDLAGMGCYSEAFRILNRLETEQESPALFCNLALCHMRAVQWDRAVKYLDRALSLHKKRRPLNLGIRSQTLGLLEQGEADGKSYLSFLPLAAPEFAPAYTKDTILRLLVDCCAELGLWERVETLAGSLQSKRYGNVERALEAMQLSGKNNI